MVSFAKIAGLSAVLAAGLVVMSEIPGAQATAPVVGKLYTDRVPQAAAAPAGIVLASYVAVPQDGETTAASNAKKGDSLRNAPEGGCATQTWPHISPDCLAAAEGTPTRGRVRTITMESREGANTSVLMRIPAPELARR